MARRYSASVVTSAAPALNTAFAELRAPSRRAFLRELGVTLGAATATNVALVRSTAVGTGGNGPLAGLPEDNNDPVGTGVLAASAFTLAPTFTAANMLRRVHLAAAIGGGIVWTWAPGDELLIPVGGSLVLYTPVIAGAAAISTYAVWDE